MEDQPLDYVCDELESEIENATKYRYDIVSAIIMAFFLGFLCGMIVADWWIK